MDFFTHQESARRRTIVLIVFFIVAVLLIIAAVYAVLCVLSPLAKPSTEDPGVPAGQSGPIASLWWQPNLLLGSIISTLAVIIAGSLFKISELRGGGCVVATSLGGSLLSRSGATLKQQLLLNVVEEMAIASGVPVPPVYVLSDEKTINAFAAGYTIDDAVIGVSQGLLDGLSRDEIQGVIAHEYSHILNGDMRMNIQLIGLLNGILLIAMIGFYCLRNSYLAGRGSRGKNNSAMYFMLFGVGVLIIGSIGLFFGRLIKASVSRQREYLADASAVQFTRNPSGIAGALKKIASNTMGSRIRTPEAESASHMFFGNVKGVSLFSLLATHPPLRDRIQRIDPQWDGTLDTQTPEQLDQSSTHGARNISTSSVTSSLAPTPHQPAGPTASPDGHARSAMATTIGAAEPLHDGELTKDIRDAIDTPYTAQAVIFALLISQDPGVKTNQLRLIRDKHGEHLSELADRYSDKLGTRRGKLIAIDLLNPSLKLLSNQQYQSMIATVDLLIVADKQINLFEFMVKRILIARNPAPDTQSKQPGVRYRSYRPIKQSIAHVMAALTYATGQDDKSSGSLYSRAMQNHFPSGRRMPRVAQQELTLQNLSASIDELSQCGPAIQKKVIECATDIISDDQHVTNNEAQIIRALAATLAIPIPAYYGT